MYINFVPYLLLMGGAAFCGMIHFTMQPGYLKRFRAKIPNFRKIFFVQKEDKKVLQRKAMEFSSRAQNGDAEAIATINERVADTTWEYFGVIIDLKHEARKLIALANEGDPPTIEILKRVIRNPNSRYFGMVRKLSNNPVHFEFVDPDVKQPVLEVKDPDMLWHSSGPMPLKGKHPGLTTKTEPLGDHMA